MSNTSARYKEGSRDWRVFFRDLRGALTYHEEDKDALFRSLRRIIGQEPNADTEERGRQAIEIFAKGAFTADVATLMNFMGFKPEDMRTSRDYFLSGVKLALEKDIVSLDCAFSGVSSEAILLADQGGLTSEDMIPLKASFQIAVKKAAREGDISKIRELKELGDLNEEDMGECGQSFLKYLKRYDPRSVKISAKDLLDMIEICNLTPDMLRPVRRKALGIISLGAPNALRVTERLALKLGMQDDPTMNKVVKELERRKAEAAKMLQTYPLKPIS
jgi:hypothetical protein